MCLPGWASEHTETLQVQAGLASLWPSECLSSRDGGARGSLAGVVIRARGCSSGRGGSKAPEVTATGPSHVDWGRSALKLRLGRKTLQCFLFFLQIRLSSEKAHCLWIRSATGLFIVNLASFDPEAVLRSRGRTSVQTTFGINFS